MKAPTLQRWLCSAALLAAMAAGAISPAEVQKKIAAGEKVTFVDVRGTALFKKGHIPGAINVPAALLPQKQLPPLGYVVVYDDGLGRDSGQPAAAALNAKPGTKAEILDGGFAAWEMAQAGSTKERGLKPEELPIISYDHLKSADSDEVVLVDLRKPNPEKSKSLSDLGAEFPKSRVTKSPFAVPAPKSKAGAAAPPLLVLIDNGDGSAQEMARTLKANGVTRVVILAGGDEIIRRQGQPGLQRAGTTIIMRKPSVPVVPNAQP